MGKRKLQSDDKKAPAEPMPQAAILEQLQHVNAQVQGLQNRLGVTDARAKADRQRLSNYRNCKTDLDSAYVPVVKYIPRHPFLPHPNLDGVQFAQDYPVDSQPPANLLPTNYKELMYQIGLSTLDEKRQRIRALFWFYNDERFQLPSDATLELCVATLISVDSFLLLS